MHEDEGGVAARRKNTPGVVSTGILRLDEVRQATTHPPVVPIAALQEPTCRLSIGLEREDVRVRSMTFQRVEKVALAEPDTNEDGGQRPTGQGGLQVFPGEAGELIALCRHTCWKHGSTPEVQSRCPACAKES